MNTDRYWESAIAEAASGRQPPDQTAEILARLNAPPVRGFLAAKPWPVRVAVHAAQTALAAGVLLAIGLATGVVQWPGPDSPPITPPIKRELIAAPGTKWVDHPEYIDLGQGALLLSTGAPEVRRGDSKFNQLDGLALVSTSEPDTQQMAEWQTWMQTKGVEEAMLKNATRWITGTVLCVLMLQGTATLDGQKVEAEKSAEPVWHKVDSLMALEKLPPEARYIETDGLDGTYLPIIATVERIEGLRFLNSRTTKAEHLQGLTKMPSLRVLDLRGCYWTDGPDYSVIAQIPKLERAGLDLFIPGRKKDEDRTEAEMRESELATKQIEAFREFARKGLKIDFSISQNAGRFAGRLAEVFPDCEDLTLAWATDDTCRDITKFSKLKRLTIKWLFAKEPGYAWLGKLAQLEQLDFSCGEFDATCAYHLAKISTLRVLKIRNDNRGGVWKAGAVTGLCSISQVRELWIDNYSHWPVISELDGQTESPFGTLKNLEVFALTGGEYHVQRFGRTIEHPFDLGFFVPAKSLVLFLQHVQEESRASGEVPEAGDAAKAAQVESIRILVAPTQFKLVAWAPKWAASLKRYPNLKRVEIGKYGERADAWHWDGLRLIEELRTAMPGIEIVQVEVQ